MASNILRNISEFIYTKAPRHKAVIRWCFAFLVAAAILNLYQSNSLERFELLSVDYRFLLKPHEQGPSDIVFIDMEEESIRAIGRWPWSRKWHATLIQILSEYNPKAIGFDVIFSEPQNETEDLVFEEALKESGVVYLPLLYNLKTQESSNLAGGIGIVSVLEPIARLKKWSKGTGHLNAIPDSDGILRRAMPIIDYEGKKSYKFGFKIGCDILGLRDKDIIFYPDEHKIDLKKPDGGIINVPLDESDQIIINWKGKWGKAFRHYSFIDIISSYALMKDGEPSPIDFNDFKNKVCIVGLTASALIDIKPIPIQKAYPAVGVAAMMINSVLNNDFIYKTPKKIDTFIIILVSFVITLALFGLRPLNGLLLAILAAIIIAGISLACFIFFNVLSVAFYPILAVFISYGLTVGYTQMLQTVERMHLFGQATRDGLTNLYNVRHFKLLLEAEFKNVSIYKSRPLSVVMTDIDNFKPINDTYGHPAGDLVLKEFAKIIESLCRQIDVVARYGGEEFIIMLVGADKKAAIDVSEKIRRAIENKKFNIKDKVISTTVSIGVAEYTNEKTKEELIENADQVLYKAKQGGKNRVEVHS